MTAERCPRCDRNYCPRWAWAVEYAAACNVTPRAAMDVQAGSRDDFDACQRHAVDWRTRSLAAEQRAEAAEAREARLREACVSAERKLSHYECRHLPHSIAAVQMIEVACDLRAALAPAAESGKETP